MRKDEIAKMRAVMFVATATELARAELEASRAALPPRPSKLPREAAAGVICWPIVACDDVWPFAAHSGELVFCSEDAALGFRAPAGIVAGLNLASLPRILHLPHVWRPPEFALGPGRSFEDIERFLKRLAATAIENAVRHGGVRTTPPPSNGGTATDGRPH